MAKKVDASEVNTTVAERVSKAGLTKDEARGGVRDRGAGNPNIKTPPESTAQAEVQAATNQERVEKDRSFVQKMD